jgi:hypothetical protein
MKRGWAIPFVRGQSSGKNTYKPISEGFSGEPCWFGRNVQVVQLGVSPGNLWKFTCLAGGYFTNNHREAMIFNMSLNHPKWGYNGYTINEHVQFGRMIQLI